MATAKPHGDEWIAIGEAARIMQCSKSWVLVLLRSGALAGKKIHSRAWAVNRKSAERNAEEYRSGTGKRRVGRPRANNAPPPNGLAHGRWVGSPRGNNPRDGGAMVAAATLLNCDGMVMRAEDLVTVGTAANVSGFHRTHIHGLIKAGKLWSCNIDGLHFIRAADAKRLRGTRTGRGRPKKSDG